MGVGFFSYILISGIRDRFIAYGLYSGFISRIAASTYR